ncbi:MAG: ATP-binding protein, partial [Acidimicrobiia bacterium]
MFTTPEQAGFGMMETMGLPLGTLTFLLSDVEGSTALWEAEREGMAVALPRSLEIVEKVASAHGGVAVAAHRLLQACPTLTLVATSREPLGVTGEVVWRVPPMTVGDDGDGDAVALFVERASAVRANFSLNDSNRELVTAVCRRLDGIPLAIELAAARVRSLSVKDIAAGLDDRFRLLAGGSRTPLARQRTLEASVQWSYELTGADE